MGNSASSTARSWRLRRSLAVTRSSSCRAKRKRWRWRPSSCSFTRISCRAGAGRARFARLPALEPRARQTRSAAMTAADAHRAILAVWRIEQPRLITSLARMLRDVPLAEDLTQEALVAALEHWSVAGVPERPGAWLMATAKRRAIDQLRHDKMRQRKHAIVAGDLADTQQV